MLTANAGLALFGELTQGLGLHRWLAQEMPLPGSRRGYEAACPMPSRFQAQRAWVQGVRYTVRLFKAPVAHLDRVLVSEASRRARQIRATIRSAMVILNSAKFRGGE